MNENNIPPVVRLLMEEDWEYLSSFNDFAKKYKKIAREVAIQAQYGYENFDYYDERKPEDRSLVITAGGGLDPFYGRDMCSDPACKVKAAKQIARTLGLYADVITIADPLSYLLADVRKPSIKQIEWLFSQMLVLRELYPLIDAGVIRFWSGKVGLCQKCYQSAQAEIETGAQELIAQIEDLVEVEVVDGHMEIRTTGIIESEITTYYKLTEENIKEIKSGITINQMAQDFVAEQIKSTIRESLFELNYSRRISSVLFSTSRRELYALKRFDRDAPSLSKLDAWEKARSIQLPWVSDLTTTQIIQLRESAEKALPAFRGTFVNHIASPTSTVESVESRIDTLRESAFEVERELKALNVHGENVFRNIAGSLGITISVYGAAAGFVPTEAALGGLMTLLGLVHSSSRHDDQKLSILQSQPGYVLVRAKELLEHA